MLPVGDGVSGHPCARPSCFMPPSSSRVGLGGVRSSHLLLAAILQHTLPSARRAERRRNLRPLTRRLSAAGPVQPPVFNGTDAHRRRRRGSTTGPDGAITRLIDLSAGARTRERRSELEGNMNGHMYSDVLTAGRHQLASHAPDQHCNHGNREVVNQHARAGLAGNSEFWKHSAFTSSRHSSGGAGPA